MARSDILETLSLAAFVKLKRSSERVSSHIHAILGDYALSESQFGVLEALHHLGPLCQRDLAQKILKTTANMTLTIDKLEQRDLVVRQRTPEDRRYYSICLTAAGQELIEELFPQVKARIVSVLSALSAAELTELGRMCKLLGTTDI